MTVKEFDYIRGPAEVLDFILELMDVDGRVTEKRDGEVVRIDVEVEDDEERLVGERFETMESLQYILGVMQAVAGEDGQVYLDVNGRRTKRDRGVEEMAQELMDEVYDFGEPVRSKRLLPSERRVIHRVAEADGKVRTFSIGDGLRKVVVIEPTEE